MSEAEKELQKQAEELDAFGEDSSRARAELEGEEDRLRHSRKQ